MALQEDIRSPLTKLCDLSDKSEPRSALQIGAGASYTSGAQDSPRAPDGAHRFYNLVLASLVAIPASAVRDRQPCKCTRMHRSPNQRCIAPIGLLTPRSSHSTLQTSRTTTAATHRSSAPRSSRAATRSSLRYPSSPGHRVTSSPSYGATLRRTRYNRYHSGARFVPMAAVPVTSSRSGTMNAVPEQPADSADPFPANTAAETAPGPRSTPRSTDFSPRPTPLPRPTPHRLPAPILPPSPPSAIRSPHHTRPVSRSPPLPVRSPNSIVRPSSPAASPVTRSAAPTILSSARTRVPRKIL